MTDRNSSSKKRVKPRKRVEYRWFVSTPMLGLCGGIVAKDAAEAASWGALEQHNKYPGSKMVRVRMEYKS